MSGLGNIFDGLEEGKGEEESAPSRGPDLRVEVEIPRNFLGDPDGIIADVPRDVPQGDTTVRRHVGPGDDPEGVRLHLPETLPDRATLRLRGQGGVEDGGRPGDLYVTVKVVAPVVAPLVQATRRWWIVAVAVAVAAAASAFLLR